MRIFGSPQSLLIVIATASLAACSHGPTIQEFPDTANPTEEVSKLDRDLSQAFAKQVDVLAPANFREARDSLHDAKDSLSRQNDRDDAKDTLHSVAEGRAYLERANLFAATSHTHIEAVIVARQQALDAEAKKRLSAEFEETDQALINVTRNIEKNDISDAVNARSDLQLRYLELELQSIKLARLTDAKKTIAQAVNEGAKDLAPRSLAIAEKSVQETDAFITGNRHDFSRISVQADETLKKSAHLLKITRAARSGKKTSAEEQALRMETEQNKVETRTNQLARGETANQALVAANSNLESEKAFNERFEDARTKFSRNEAEVYKQGNVLTIRLRGLEFPVAQAVLKGSNFPLLAKVQQVIQSFGKSTVVVEGHTDSVGGKVANEKLSAERADAVREYLAVNSGDSTLNIRAIGYGYQKPLSTNKTAKGRAENRRVDVLITPDTTTAL